MWIILFYSYNHSQIDKFAPNINSVMVDIRKTIPSHILKTHMLKYWFPYTSFSYSQQTSLEQDKKLYHVTSIQNY